MRWFLTLCVLTRALEIHTTGGSRGLVETAVAPSSDADHAVLEDHEVPATDHHDDDAVRCGAGNSIAVGLIAGAVLIPLVTYMGMEDGTIQYLTLKMLDTFTSIFLAVLWFNAFRQLVHYFELRRSTELVAGLLQFVALYIIALVIANITRDKKMALVTFCSCAAHYVAFSGVFFGKLGQEDMSGMVGEENAPYFSVAFVFVVMAFFAALFAISFHGWRKKVGHDEFQEEMDDVEADIGAIVISFLVTQAVRHMITGQYPATSHLQIQSGHELVHDPRHVVHTPFQRWFMLGWAIVLTVFTALAVPALDSLASDNYFKQRVIRAMKVTCVMMVAWGYLLWGQWQFHEVLFHGDRMYGQMVFALVASFVCLGVLILLGKWMEWKHRSVQETNTMTITVTGVSLVAAWSWEFCFNTAFDIIGERYQVGYGGLVPKLCLAVFVPLVVLPVYVKHIKRRVVELSEAEPKQEEVLVPDLEQVEPKQEEVSVPDLEQEVRQ